MTPDQRTALKAAAERIKAMDWQHPDWDSSDGPNLARTVAAGCLEVLAELERAWKIAEEVHGEEVCIDNLLKENRELKAEVERLKNKKCVHQLAKEYLEGNHDNCAECGRWASRLTDEGHEETCSVGRALTPFLCPSCGSRHFGRDVRGLPMPDGTLGVRTPYVEALPTVACHDEFQTGCKWRGEWPPKETT